MSSPLILPGDVEFTRTIGQLPAWWEKFAHENEGWCNFGVDVDSGLLKPLNKQGTIDYIWGGEFQEIYDREGYEEKEVFGDYSKSELEEVEEFFIDL